MIGQVPAAVVLPESSSATDFADQHRHTGHQIVAEGMADSGFGKRLRSSAQTQRNCEFPDLQLHNSASSDSPREPAECLSVTYLNHSKRAAVSKPTPSLLDHSGVAER